MLILTRKIGETLLIGDNIRVVVLDVRGKQIRLGIDAPPEVLILREEILQRLAQENEQSAAFHLPDLQAASACARHAIQQSVGLKNSKPASIAVETRHFGQVLVSENQIIAFPQGLPGFPEFRRYAVIETSQISPFLELQCLDNASLAFVAAEPVKLVSDYKIGPVGSALQEIEATDQQELKLLVLLTIPPGHPQELTANLTGPILINPRLGRAKQIVIENSRYSPKHPVIPGKAS